jgi:hypothetical protein
LGGEEVRRKATKLERTREWVVEELNNYTHTGGQNQTAKEKVMEDKLHELLDEIGRGSRVEATYCVEEFAGALFAVICERRVRG